ncbi:hypothetical protein [Enterococcus casseliflavus]|uniref:hypothetical protein n=1 Tax=Enterococcus casseliflavus TaxID=37734 RepID=UPI00325AC609
MDFNKAIENLIGLATGSKDPLALNAVMEVQKQLILIQEENRVLREELHDLKNDRIIESQLEYKDGYYVRNTDGRMFCSKCWDSEKKMISTSEGDLGQFCPVCDRYVG